MKITRIVLMTIFSTMLAACASSPMVRDGSGVNTLPNSQSNTGGGNAASVKKSGGYYLDDGPSDNAPADIDSIADAVPRKEPLLARANKPYIALGNSYKPMTSYEPFKQAGKASWYGKRYHGRKTSSGEIYDMFGMTAAHTTLPLPSYVRVTNPANGKSVIVRVNDRGPFHEERIIDLSYAAAYRLRLTSAGSGHVEVETIDASNFKPSNTIAATSQPIDSQAITPTKASETNAGLAQYYVQVGAFKSDANAVKLGNRIQSLDLANNIEISNALDQDGFYRVKLGPYVNRQEAELSASDLRKKLSITALVVNQ